MRTRGYVVCALGLLFLALLALASGGGGSVGLLPYAFATFLLLSGGIMIAKGAPLAPHAAGAGDATQPLPMTPAVAAIIARESDRTWRVVLWIVAGCIAASAVLGGTIGVVSRQPGAWLPIFVAFVVLGAATGFAILLSSWLSSRRLMMRDVRGSTYFRTTGPISVVRLPAGAMLRLADRAFVLSARGGLPELSALTGGTVDYGAQGHLVLGVWDDRGNSVFRLPGYDAQAPMPNAPATLTERSTSDSEA